MNTAAIPTETILGQVTRKEIVESQVQATFERVQSLMEQGWNFEVETILKRTLLYAALMENTNWGKLFYDVFKIYLTHPLCNAEFILELLRDTRAKITTTKGRVFKGILDVFISVKQENKFIVSEKNEPIILSALFSSFDFVDALELQALEAKNADIIVNLIFTALRYKDLKNEREVRKLLRILCILKGIPEEEYDLYFQTIKLMRIEAEAKESNES